MFSKSLKESDPKVFETIVGEYERQRDGIELIASENIVSRAVLEAQGSVMTNKYAEGYPGKRYYGGCECVDEVEVLAQERAKQLFGCAFANVQPHSGSQANQAVFMALLAPGDKILGMALDQGGHLTHGAKVNQSGKWFEAHAYGIDANGMIDYDHVLAEAKKVQPKLIIAGASAYPREIDFAKFKEIADAVGAYLMVDMAHIAGLVATGLHCHPFPYADVVTTTTHKTLRGPRGGMVLTNNADIAKKVNSAVFPGLQGGPLMHVIAGKAVAFGEALDGSFKAYMEQVVKNTAALGTILRERGYSLISDGTDNHLILVDLRKQGLAGKDAEVVLEAAGLTCNKNSVPQDPMPPQKTSGIRLGAAAATSRGLAEKEFNQVGIWIADILDALVDGEDKALAKAQGVYADVKKMCEEFPIYPENVVNG